MAAEVETLTKTRDNLLTQSERLVIQTTKLEKEIVEHRQQINSNKNTIQQLEKLKQRNFYKLFVFMNNRPFLKCFANPYGS